MNVYTCYFIEPDGSVPLFDTVEAESTPEAVERATRMLRFAPERDAIEIWLNDRRLSTLTLKLTRADA